MTKDNDSPRPPPTMAKAEPEPSSSSTGDYGSPGKDILGLPSNFFKQFHSPEKKQDTSSCTDMVLHEKSKPIYKRSMAKSNLALDERADTSRPTLRRQLAKNNFDLDTQDLQTLAMALESKYQKDNEKAPGETPSTPKKKKNGKAKAKSKPKAHAKPAPKSKSKGKAKKQKTSKKTSPGTYKTTFRHRKTSNAYHLAKNMALRAGISPESARIKGKAASAKVVQQIELGTLKEG